MSNEFTRDWFDDGRDPAQDDPVRAARLGMKPALPKRFYEKVSVGEVSGRHAVLLDGRPARTKGKAVLSGPNLAVAELLAAEWAAQTAEINPATMPATRIVHAALDHVAQAMGEVRADILKYAASDLVCYRAAIPRASSSGRRSIGTRCWRISVRAMARAFCSRRESLL